MFCNKNIKKVVYLHDFQNFCKYTSYYTVYNQQYTVIPGIFIDSGIDFEKFLHVVSPIRTQLSKNTRQSSCTFNFMRVKYHVGHLADRCE